MNTVSKAYMQDFLDDIMSNDLGSDINSDACVITDGAIEVHCWDGKRFLIQQQPDGCKYSTDTGLPIND